ncbi:MAG: molybdopterin molybdotransferase MoeA [Planctomycetota bacterium]
MITVDEALSLIDASINNLGTEQISIENSCGRVLATDIVARYDLPTFTQSAMDGFAINFEETINATQDNPVKFEIDGEVYATVSIKLERIEKGKTVKIYTGVSLPVGTNAVVVKEEAKIEGNNLLVYRKVKPWENVRIAGEEVKKGTLLINKGTKLTPGILAILASQGYSQIEVFRRPNIAIITTGNEVVRLTETLHLGQVYNINEIFLCSFFKSRGYNITYIQHVPDQITNLIGTIQRAMQKANVIITTGGVSVGDKDLVKSAAKSWEFKEIFWRIAQKPGKPLYFAKRNNIYLFGLPGNPASAFICFIIYGIHLLEKLEGVSLPYPCYNYGILNKSITPDPNKTMWVRCGLEYTKEGKAILEPLPKQASHMITNLTNTRVIARIEPHTTPLQEGTVVSYVNLPFF